MKNYIIFLKIITIISFFTGANILGQTSTPPSNGDGSEANPYQIATLDNLYWLSQTDTVWNKFFIQTTDINAASTSNWDGGLGFMPIGYNPTKFSGTYDGDGHIIDSLFIDRPDSDYVGLFGLARGHIKELGVTNADITGYYYCGAIVGFNQLEVRNCYASGTISGYSSVGGVVGGNSYARIYNSYSLCHVNGKGYIGSFLGYNSAGTIKNCYSKGNVKRVLALFEFCGSFCGASRNAKIEYCYSTGNVEYESGTTPTDKGFLGDDVGGNTFTSNFFDSTASNQKTDVFGAATAKITSEMKDYTTFIDAGWDFVSEIANGTDDYWEADETGVINDGYVVLTWQSGTNGVNPVELVSFTAKIIGENIVLNWATATEVNNYGFAVECKAGIENREWKEIGFVEGHGNSNSPNSYSFVDSDNLVGVVQYRLRQIDINGSFEYSNIVEINNSTLAKIIFEQNYPNPFNPSTIFSFSIPTEEFVILAIYNSLGEKVAEIINDRMNAGTYKSVWNARGVTTGVYFARLTVGAKTEVQKILLLK